MFEFFRRHTRVLQFVLVLLIFPSFVFFGIQGYSSYSNERAAPVAEVAGTPITQAEFEANLRERVDQARRQMPNLDASLFDTPQMRALALDALVRDRVLLAAADKLHLTTTDERLDRSFKSDPQFAQLRNPDGSLNREAIATFGLSSEGFAARLRQDLTRRQVLQAVVDSSLAPAAAASGALDAMYQQREAQTVRFEPKDQLARAQPDEAQIEAYYKANPARFLAPEEAAVEYVVLDLEALKKGVTVPEDDLRKYYDENIARYTVPEERRARHILVEADKDAPKADRDKARAKAETLLADVRKDPSRFAEIAKANSDDKGSAENGGDLDFNARGAWVQPFADAAWALKPGETSGVVVSDFGFHIIKLEAVRGGDRKPFEAARPEIEAEVRNALAAKEFSKVALEFDDMVFQQADSLKPAADKWKLAVVKAEHVTRTPAPGAKGALANQRFLEALFAAEVTNDKRNTKAIDIGQNQLAAGRVVAFVPARPRPFAEVKEQIRGQLAAERAAALAREAGVAKLATARAAPQQSIGDNSVVVSRMQTRDMPAQLVDAILRAPAATLPVVVGVDLGEQGYAIARVTKVWGRDPGAMDARASDQYARIWGAAEGDAYYAALKQRFKVSVSKAPVPNRADTDAASAPR